MGSESSVDSAAIFPLVSASVNSGALVPIFGAPTEGGNCREAYSVAYPKRAAAAKLSTQGLIGIGREALGYLAKKAPEIVVANVAGEVPTQYILRYVPEVNEAKPKQFRNITVQVALSNVKVRARKGYYPEEPGTPTSANTSSSPSR